ncbi:hypothetical protein Hypma_001667 [Hypsizygus marmoreus]|uniref:hAT-like transposase RNase-H fold domain-containing protein n=1 Tax=Hypsizygus marmoreus TaxID=39966 RepID=A0A369J9L2_HYPMA|nr:hypothetical protein Hypma_001667 [Hypsizygus marmoreus]
MGKGGSKLFAATLDNTSMNTTICKTVEDIYLRRALSQWDAGEGQLPCLGHVVNLGNVAVMGHITKIAAVQMTTAIWEYDPTDLDNRVLGGSVDVVVAIRTLSIKDSNCIQQYFSAEKQPTLWRALPALEELQTAWEKKCDDPHYAPYRDALTDGLEKLNKYYALLNKYYALLDKKPAFVLALVFHPYYKLAYIKHAWGSEEEQEAEIAVGNTYVKNWQDKASKIVDRMVEEYWKSRPRAAPMQDNEPTISLEQDKNISDFDRHHLKLLTQDDQEGWHSELRRYLKDVPADVTKETDIIEW